MNIFNINTISSKKWLLFTFYGYKISQNKIDQKLKNIDILRRKLRILSNKNYF